MYLRLIYTSRANVPIQIDQILKESRSWNASVAITGGLALMDDVFIQYLEGSERDVNAIFDKIKGDRRHRDVKVLERRTVPRRMFPNWSMGMLRWCDETKAIFRSFSPGCVLDLYETDPSTAAPLFRAWAASDSWNGVVGKGFCRVKHWPVR
jgi:hypothetical protein